MLDDLVQIVQIVLLPYHAITLVVFAKDGQNQSRDRERFHAKLHTPKVVEVHAKCSLSGPLGRIWP